MINVVSIEVNSARLRMAEDGLNQLSRVIDVLMANSPSKELSQEEEKQAVRAAVGYLCIGAAACHLLADTIETLERGGGQDG